MKNSSHRQVKKLLQDHIGSRVEPGFDLSSILPESLLIFLCQEEKSAKETGKELSQQTVSWNTENF